MLRSLHRAVYFFAGPSVRKFIRKLRRAYQGPGPHPRLETVRRELGITDANGRAQAW